MITIFAIPKAFDGRFKIIQTNAIRSWAMLQPKPEIILFGDDAGTGEIASELRLRHVCDIERNQYGTPLTDGIFDAGQKLASNSLVCYVNSDIILMSDFMDMVKTVCVQFGNRGFVIIGRKISVDIPDLLDFTAAEWEASLKRLLDGKGEYVTYDSDFFVFPKGTFYAMPAFAVGRCFWTQWLIYDTRRRGIAVVDATSAVVSVESKHDYSHVASTGGATRLSGVEYVANRRLFKKSGAKYFMTLDASHIMTRSGLEKNHLRNRVKSWLVRFEYWVYFLLKGELYPYSVPLVVLLRWSRVGLRGIISPFRRTGGRCGPRIMQ
ncbi:MAG: hypothetical protein ACE5JU_08935 [Candidatus Binatia bacterium]